MCMRLTTNARQTFTASCIVLSLLYTVYYKLLKLFFDFSFWFLLLKIMRKVMYGMERRRSIMHSTVRRLNSFSVVNLVSSWVSIWQFQSFFYSFIIVFFLLFRIIDFSEFTSILFWYILITFKLKERNRESHVYCMVLKKIRTTRSILKKYFCIWSFFC